MMVEPWRAEPRGRPLGREGRGGSGVWKVRGVAISGNYGLSTDDAWSNTFSLANFCVVEAPGIQELQAKHGS